MKVLQIISSLQTGGAEKLLVDTAPRLSAKGVTCDILTLNNNETPFGQELEKRGIKITGLSKTMNLYDPRFIFKIAPYLNRYDIVHTHLTQPQYWTAFAKIISPKSRARLVTTEHNTSNRRRDKKIMKPIDRKVYRQYEKIIAISHATASNLASYIVDNNDIIIITNGIDVDCFHNAAPVNRRLLNLSIKADDFIITMVGGFREQKDQDTIIKTLNSLPENIKLILVGDGRRRKECEKLAEKERVSDRVFFTGIRNDVANILQASNAVVMSSHYEGFGLAAVEGMAVRKPLIASDVPGLADIVRGAGLLFPAGDQKKLSELILRLKNDEVYYDEVSMACLDRAKEYHVEKMADRLIHLYKSVLGNELQEKTS